MRAGRIFAIGLAGACLAIAACTQTASHQKDASLAQSAWVKRGAAGRLEYAKTPQGDQIMDFSYAGYHSGGVPLPNVPVIKTLSPLGNNQDDTAQIQSALDDLAKLPLTNNFRGALLLNPGTYTCSVTINISASGIVLRGSGSSGPNTTTLLLTGKPHLGLSIRQPGGNRRRNAPTTPDAETPDAAPTPTTPESPSTFHTQLAPDYTPSGSSTLTVKDPSGLRPGDWISIRKPVTTAWSHFMGMDDMVREGKHQTWIKLDTSIPTDRSITAINGNSLTLDVPLSDGYDQKYLTPPGIDVLKIPAPAQISESAFEHLHIQCPPQQINHTEAHYQAMHLGGQDLWAQDIIADETMNSVSVSGRRITLTHIAVNRKAPHLGASKPAEFAPNGTQVLLDRCSVSADNVWFSATGAEVSGPIVLLNCVFRGAGRSEAHQRWSTGMLYDNCVAPEGGIEIRNRGSMGSGHGWGLGFGVVWNCDTKMYIVQDPPGAKNWLIGSTGENELSARPFGSGPMLPAGTLDSPNIHVAPRSLYLALQKPVSATNSKQSLPQFAADNALDGDPNTYWATDDTITKATLELDTEGATQISAVRITEALGQRIQQYKVEGEIDSGWVTLTEGNMISPSEVKHFPLTTVWKVRLTILKSSSAPAIAEFAMYHEKDAH